MLTTHYSLLTAHCSLLATHCSLPTAYCGSGYAYQVRDEPAYRAARRLQTSLVVSSFKEQRALEYVAHCQPSWREHNRLRCSRVYPKGSRVDSSNVSARDACRLWSAGVQKP